MGVTRPLPRTMSAVDVTRQGGCAEAGNARNWSALRICWLFDRWGYPLFVTKTGIAPRLRVRQNRSERADLSYRKLVAEKQH